MKKTLLLSLFVLLFVAVSCSSTQRSGYLISSVISSDDSAYLSRHKAENKPLLISTKGNSTEVVFSSIPESTEPIRIYLVTDTATTELKYRNKDKAFEIDYLLKEGETLSFKQEKDIAVITRIKKIGDYK